MITIPYFAMFPDDAIPMLQVTKKRGIPNKIYGFVDWFCISQTCDCRHAYIHVRDMENGSLLAVISYGWEPLPYYRKWMYAKGKEMDDFLMEFKGPTLSLDHPQSANAQAFLSLFKELLEDEAYQKGITERYDKFKEVIDAMSEEELEELEDRILNGDDIDEDDDEYDDDEYDDDDSQSGPPVIDFRSSNSGPQEPRKVTKVGRNEPCTCGSGKKYKKCCGA